MKKRVIMLVALLAVVAIAVPAFALEFKYGGMYRLRWQSNDNLADGGAEGYALDNTKTRQDPSVSTRHRGSIQTTVYDSPWNIFTSNVAALYYF